MVLYHGTTYNAWKSIYNNRQIETANAETSPYAKCGGLSTEYGYVYLVGNEIDALEYASRAWSLSNEGGHHSGRLLIVIKVDIPENELETDQVEDDRRPTTYEKGPYHRIKRNIAFNEIISVAPFQYCNFQASCDDIEAWIDGKKKTDDIVWCEPCSSFKKWNGTWKMF